MGIFWPVASPLGSDPPRHESAETITNYSYHQSMLRVKMITSDQLAIGKETGRRLGMGTNIYPSSALLGQHPDESTCSLLMSLLKRLVSSLIVVGSKCLSYNKEKLDALTSLILYFMSIHYMGLAAILELAGETCIIKYK